MQGHFQRVLDFIHLLASCYFIPLGSETDKGINKDKQKRCFEALSGQFIFKTKNIVVPNLAQALVIAL